MLRGWKTWLLRLKEGDSLSTLHMWVGLEKKEEEEEADDDEYEDE